MAKDAKYLQITQWILGQIQNGELRGGDKLESEHELAGRFGLSRQTVRHALDVLEQEGLVNRVQGSGTFIRDTAEPKRLSRDLSDTVTIVSTYVDGYIFSGILQAMVGRLEQSDYHAQIMFTGNRLDTERKILLKLMEEGRRDPLIVEPVMSGLPNPNLDLYRKLRKEGIPVLFFHSYYPGLDIPHVGMDDEEAGEKATAYLIEKGHTDIGGIFKADDGQGRRRYQGYLQALLKAGLEIREERVCWIDTQEMTDFPEMSPRIWKRLSGCTACVCYNDEVAHMLEEQAPAQGRRVPEDLSVISFDDSDLARLSPVPLTSVAHPKKKLGEKAAEMMLRLTEDPLFHSDYEFSAKITERSSVKERKTGGKRL